MSASNLLSQEKLLVDRKAYEPSMEEILASIRRIIADDQVFPGSSPIQEEAAASLDDAAPENAIKPVKAAPSVVASASVVPMTVGMQTAAHAEGEANVETLVRPRPVVTTKTAEPSYEVKMSGIAPPAPAPRVEAPSYSSAAPYVSQQAAPVPQNIAPTAERTPADLPPEIASSVIGPELGLKGSVQPSELPDDAPLVSLATDQAVANAFNTLVASRFVQASESMNDMVRDMIRPMLKAWLDDNLPIMVERLVRAEIERVARGGR